MYVDAVPGLKQDKRLVEILSRRYFDPLNHVQSVRNLKRLRRITVEESTAYSLRSAERVMANDAGFFFDGSGHHFVHTAIV